MRVTWYLFGVFILTLGDINLADTIGISLHEDAAAVGAPAVNSVVLKPLIQRWKRHVTVHGKHEKIVGLKEKKEEIKKILEKKKEAFKIGLEKKKAAFKDIVQKKKAVILHKKKKIVSLISAKWAKIRAAIKQKYIIMKKKWKKPDVIYDRILNIFREALLEHLESTCHVIKTKLRFKREIAKIYQSPAANTTANSAARPSGPVSPNARTQPQQQRRRLKPASVSSAGAASNSKSQTTTNVIIDTKPKKNPLKDYKILFKETLEIIREVMRTKLILSLIDGAKAEFRTMKDKCIQALNQNQYPEGLVRVYQQPSIPFVNQDPQDDSSNDEQQITPDNQQHEQPHVE